MSNTDTESVTKQVATADVVQPRSAQQALDMFHLMFTEVLAEAEGILSEWDGVTSQKETAAKDALSRASQSYVRRYGVMDVPLCSFGSDKNQREMAKNAVLKRLRSTE